jgi:hypothetical protein
MLETNLMLQIMRLKLYTLCTHRLFICIYIYVFVMYLCLIMVHNKGRNMWHCICSNTKLCMTVLIAYFKKSGHNMINLIKNVIKINKRPTSGTDILNIRIM